MTGEREKGSESALDARRKALGAAIERKQAAERGKSAAEAEAAGIGASYSRSAMAMGFRLAADFLSAVLVGGALGLGIDKLAGSSPWGLMIFLLLGFAAGVVNILRLLGRLPNKGKNSG